VVANAGPDGIAQYGAPYQLQGSGGTHYEWSPAFPLNNAYIDNPQAILYDSTIFILKAWNDDANCAGYDTVLIRVYRGPTFYVPTAFSPNGDGLNDIFRPTPVGIQSLEYFRVYNRYGELIFETNDMTKGWDGTYKGMKQNPDNYVWTLKGVDRYGTLKVLSGNVVLVR
jgi:gliding motility-associated-like protein